MATVSTTNYGFGKPQIGGSLNLWGSELNTTIDSIDTEVKRVADIKSGSPVSYNAIANPCFRLHNRFGSAYTMGTTDIPNVLDGWDYKEESSAGATTTIARYQIQTNVLNQSGYNNLTPYAVGFDMDYTGNTTAASTVVFRTPIRGYDLPNFLGDTNATLSFWAKYPTTGTYCVAFTTWNGLDTTTSLSYIAEFSIGSVNWEKVVVKVPMTVTLYTLIASTGSADLDLEIQKANFLNIIFPLEVQADRQASASTWHNTSTGQFVTSNHATTIKKYTAGLNNQWVYVTQFKFEPGNTATAFINLPMYKEIENCQRHVETSLPLNTGGGVAASLGVIARHSRDETTTSRIADSMERKVFLTYTSSDPGRTLSYSLDSYKEDGSAGGGGSATEKRVIAAGGFPQQTGDYSHYIIFQDDAFTA